jgi:peptidoglycan/LPS O-acetylase OafA/YrhL
MSQDRAPNEAGPNEPPVEQRLGISGQFSVFIHCWRTLATFAVFLGHATRPDLLFDVDFSLIGRATIPTFLIVSGYFTTMSFAHGGRFMKKVAKRYFNMWVFFIPASALVLAMDMYLISVDSVILSRDKFDPDMSVTRIAIDLFNMLTFSGEYWAKSTFGQGVFSNEAFWTMDYIMGYSLLTAALYLLTGWQRVFGTLLICALLGPTVLLLSPLWFAGVAAYETHRRWLFRDGRTSVTHLVDRLHRRGWRTDLSTLRRVAIVVSIGVFPAWAAFEYYAVGPELYAWSKTLLPYEWRQHMGMAKRYLWQWAYLPGLFGLLVLARLFLDGPATGWFSRLAAMGSRYAFPVYAIHFTLLYLLQSLIPDYTPRHDTSGPYIMMIVSLALSVLFGYVCYRWVKPVTDVWAKRIFG